jgi:site-specific recombinase XerD
VQDVSSQHPAQYIQYRGRRQYIAFSDAPSLQQFIQFLRCEGIIAAEEPSPSPATPVEQCVQKFESYLRDERALVVGTITHYVWFVRSFLRELFADGEVQLGNMAAEDVVGFVRRQASRLHMHRAKQLTTALRSFFRYTRYRGNISADLAAAVPRVAAWSMSSIPRAIPQDEACKLLSCIDRRNAKGLRDYAILLLLSRLGLRSSEVAFLELDDMDWKVGCLTVHGKGRNTRLPIPADVGDAIAAYLQHGRPRSTSRRLFLRSTAPFRGFQGATSISGMIRCTIERAGINTPTRGAHQFRHALATEMLRNGASLTEIGGLLGHRSIEVTNIYAKVDLTALRTLALAWPGGAR